MSEDVANHVRNLIMSGSVRPGEFVRLDETAADLGVSVTPVREALVALRGEGMVELVPASRLSRLAPQSPGHRRHLLVAGADRGQAGVAGDGQHHR